MQVKILYEEEKLKKAIAATLIAGILIIGALGISFITSIESIADSLNNIQDIKEIENCFTLDYYYTNVDYIYKKAGIKEVANESR